MTEFKGLKSIKNFKAVYSTEEDDLLNDFFIPCLSSSIKYDRISGFFSSILYPMIFRGIKDLILKEDSKIRLIIGFLPKIEKKIFSKNNLELYDFLYNDDFINDVNEQFEKNEPLLKKNHLKLLAWLLLNKKIEIKLGLLIDDEGYIINDPEKIKLGKGKLHKKIGIFYDEFKNFLSFCGSNNETPYGWQKNFEEFDIHYSWDGSLKGLPWLEKHQKKFEDYWENRVKGLITVNLPNKSIEKLKSFAPNKFDEIEIDEIIEFYEDIEKYDLNTALKNNREEIDFKIFWKKDNITGKLELDKYDWEQHQIGPNNWINNNYIGLFEMATGTGKTYTAIRCVYNLINFKKYMLCWVIVPDKFLITQWNVKLNELTKNIFILGIADKKSREKLEELIDIFKVKSKREKYYFLFFLSTTKMIEKIINILNNANVSSNKLLLIADEAHSLGAIKTRESLTKFKNPPLYKIGLTATPLRYFDPIGTDFIFEFFNNRVVYKLTLEDALIKGFLCPYEYYLKFCELTRTENEKYEEYTKKIRILDKTEDEEELVKLYNLRAKIIKKAENKLQVFKKLLSKLINKDLFEHSLIYCDDHYQLLLVANILENFSQNYRIIDARTKPEERLDIINLLRYNHINTILAMKCLDQGVDIPFLKLGIFLSSSGNEKEFIQRRGRLLRKDPSKKIVRIYDIIVKKSAEKGDDTFLREKERIRLFNQLAINKVDVELEFFEELGDLL